MRIILFYFLSVWGFRRFPLTPQLEELGSEVQDPVGAGVEGGKGRNGTGTPYVHVAGLEKSRAGIAATSAYVSGPKRNSSAEGSAELLFHFFRHSNQRYN